MPFVVRSTIAAELQSFRRLATESATNRRPVLTQIGFYLLAKEQEHFNRLVTTGSSNGVTWPKPSDATLARRRALAKRGLLANADPEQIGVLSGKLAGGFRFRTTSNQVRISNVTPYAGAFGARRPLYPTSFPGDWLAGCDAIAQRGIDRLFRNS